MEKTLQRDGQRKQITQREIDKGDRHQQTGFTAGTVADDHELSANLSHDAMMGDGLGVEVVGGLGVTEGWQAALERWRTWGIHGEINRRREGR